MLFVRALFPQFYLSRKWTHTDTRTKQQTGAHSNPTSESVYSKDIPALHTPRSLSAAAVQQTKEVSSLPPLPQCHTAVKCSHATP